MVQETQYSMVFCVLYILYYGYRTCFSYHGFGSPRKYIYIYMCVCVGLMDVITNKIYIVSHGGIATTGAIKTSG